MAGIGKFVTGFFKGMKRGNLTHYGDLEGPITKLKSGKMVIGIENGKCIAWTAGCDDVELSRDTVESLALCGSRCVSDFGGGNIVKDVNIYDLTMKSGQTGTLRLDLAIESDVLHLLGVEPKKELQAASTDGSDNDNPQNKPIEWFSSKAGLNAYSTYITAQNYMLADTYAAEFKRRNPDCSYEIFLEVYHKGAKLPDTYFRSLVDAINVQPLTIVGPNKALVMFLKECAKPYKINEDGEPEARKTDLTPEQIVTVDKNPLLYFVKNFNVFDIKDDALGTAIDKNKLYIAALTFIAVCIGDIEIEKQQWLFDKDTYLNDFGTVRKEKGFLKKCREVSGIPEYFDAALSKLDENN